MYRTTWEEFFNCLYLAHIDQFKIFNFPNFKEKANKLISI